MERFEPIKNNSIPVDSFKQEQLKKPKPIIGCFCDRDGLGYEDFLYDIDKIKKDAIFVDYNLKGEKLLSSGLSNGGHESYVISMCNEKNKYTTGVFDCTSVVAVGTDKKTGKNISFLSHQDPEFLNKDIENKKQFMKDLEKNLKFLDENCVSGTIDIVILGGNKEDVSEKKPSEKFVKGRDDESQFLQNEYDLYKDSINFLTFVSKKHNLKPIVMMGPNSNLNNYDNSLSIYFDNNNRRLYMIRPKNESENNENFNPEDFDSQIDKIKKIENQKRIEKLKENEKNK